MRLGDFRFQTDYNNQPLGKVILVGMLEDGPTGRGFTYHAKSRLMSTLGDNPVTQSYQYLLESGIREDNIILYRLNGLPSELVLRNGDDTAVLGFKALVNHELENNIRVRVNPEGLTLYSDYPSEQTLTGVRKDFVRTYRFSDYLVPDDEDGMLLSLPVLSEAITKDALFGLHPVVAQALTDYIAPEDWAPGGTLLTLSDQPLSGGDSESGLCKHRDEFSTQDTEEYWVRFRQYVLGQNYDGDSLTPLTQHQAELLYFADFPADRDARVPRLAARLAQQKTASQHILCSAVFGTSIVPAIQTLGTNEYMIGDDRYYSELTRDEEDWRPKDSQQAFIRRLNLLFSEQDTLSTAMQHLHIVVGDDNRSDTLLSAGAHFTQLLLRKRPGKPVTNQELVDFAKINVELPKVVVAKLSANGYICSVPSIRRHMVLTEVKHFQYPESSGYVTYGTRRLLSYIQHDLTRLLDTYIGNTHDAFRQASVKEDLDGYLAQYVQEDIFANYALDVQAPQTPTDNARIHLRIQFYDEIVSLASRLTLDDEGRSIDLWQLTTD